MNNPIERESLLWLCGLGEAEMCFDLHRGKYPRIRLGMVDKDVVGRAATVMGSGVRLTLHAPPIQPMWHTEISGARAAEVMEQMLPMMGARRGAKIASILAAYKLAGAVNGQTPGPRVVRPPGIQRRTSAAA